MTTLLQWTWEQPQTLVGAILAFFLEQRYHRHHDRVVILTYQKMAVSLGRYIILWGGKVSAIDHEYGHCRQSSYLGPLYLIVVGIPSGLRALRARYYVETGSNPAWVDRWYHRGWTERWADRLGG